jgi:hypothetical protein
VNLAEEDFVEIKRIHPAFEPNDWTTLDYARLFLVLSIPPDKLFDQVQVLFGTADMKESATLFRMLYFFPEKEQFVERAIDGVRTNMTNVFDAIASNNAFPAEYFPEGAWNQLVLKSIFMERPLFRIFGLDERRNRALAEIARDFAHERWSAGRKVVPEVWRLVAPFVDAEFIGDLRKAIDLDPAGLGAQAAAKALLEGGYSQLLDQIETVPETANSWEAIGRQFEKTLL